MQIDKAACVQKTHNFLYCFSNSEMLSSICSDTLWIASCLRGLTAGHFNFSVVISPFTLYKTYQCQVSIDLQDGNRSFLHRLLSATSWLPSLCIPQQCGSHEEEAGLRMWSEYPIQPHWNLHEARVCTDHSGIWWIKTQWHSRRWLKQNIMQSCKNSAPLTTVQKTSVPGNVVFWVFAVIGESTKQVAFVANQWKAVAKTRARRGAILRVFCF